MLKFLPRNRLTKLVALAGLSAALAGCNTETLIPSSEIGSTENGVYTQSGRFFIVGKLFPFVKESAIYEIKNNNGNYVAEIVLESPEENGIPCSFTGITAHKNTLYASCTYSAPTGAEGAAGEAPTHSVIAKVDTDEPPENEDFAEFAFLSGPFIGPNGMATDRKGNIYFSNSFSFAGALLFGVHEPSIFKATPSVEGEFSVNVDAWYPALPTDYFPNGIQIQGRNLFYVTGTKLQRIRIKKDGSAGVPVTLYEAKTCNIMDDFDISPFGIITTSEIRSPFTDFDFLLSPDAPCEALPHGKIVTISSEVPGIVYGEHIFDDGTLPSSLRFTKGKVFEPNAIVTTDFYGGAITLVTD